MLNNEDGCTRYLMREMDPSEEIEFERKMMKDENLLIEVETLRKTYAKLGNLPVHEPPAFLTEKVRKQMIGSQREKLLQSRSWRSYLPGAAAAVLLTIAVTALIRTQPTQQKPDPTLSTPTVTIPTPANNQTPVQPWVDRNESLYFAGTSLNGNQDDQIQVEVQKSLQKLKLVDSSPGINSSPRKIMLTSSN